MILVYTALARIHVTDRIEKIKRSRRNAHLHIARRKRGSRKISSQTELDIPQLSAGKPQILNGGRAGECCTRAMQATIITQLRI